MVLGGNRSGWCLYACRSAASRSLFGMVETDGSGCDTFEINFIGEESPIGKEE